MKVLVPKTFDFVDVVWCMYMADNCTDLRCVLCNIAFRRLHYDDNHYRPCEEPMEDVPTCVLEATHGEEDIMVDGDILSASDNDSDTEDSDNEESSS